MASENTTITVGVLALQGAFKEHLELLQQASKGLASQKEKNARSEHVDWKFIEVRTEADLWTCDALIIPGGESTTMSLVASRNGLLEPLREYVKVHRRPVWGTCAGLILLAESANRTKKGGQDLIGGLDVRVQRNHFGRQVESFVTDLDLPFLKADGSPSPSSSSQPSFKGIFIRAPIVEQVLPAGAEHETEKTPDEQGVNGSVAAPDKQPRDQLASELAQEEVEVLASLPRRTGQADQKGPEDGKGDIIAVKQGNVFGTSFHPELSGDPRIHVWWLGQALDLIDRMHCGER